MNFSKGVWFAVEYLVLVRDQPDFADELIKEAGITKKIAERILEQTQYEVEKLKKSLKIFKEQKGEKIAGKLQQSNNKT